MNNYEKILITGGAGFIGGHLVDRFLKKSDSKIYNLDYLGYASNPYRIENSDKYKNRYLLIQADLKDVNSIGKAIIDTDPDLIIHLAAESHVDRSLDNPNSFIESNIIGTFNMLESSLKHYQKLSKERKKIFKFYHISTDEVFGSLSEKGQFNENTPYSPRSPYSASKASSDHLVRAWYHSYGLPIIISNCSNNYGPYQFPEKLIPLAILKGIEGEKIPLYGEGNNIRDWLYVDDHIDAILKIIYNGLIGETYCIGGNNEISNKKVLHLICNYLDEIIPKDEPHNSLITNVFDRPGHDFRYSISTKKIKNSIGWQPKTNFADGLLNTINWYLKNKEWCKKVQNFSGYKGERIGRKNLY